MKLIRFVIISAGLLLPLTSLAASLTFAPAASGAREGELYTVPISIASPDAAVYTVKAVVRYAPDIFTAVSFSFGPGWLPLQQPGYDAMDTAQGLVIKTAGYPGGVTAPVLFGTLTLRARASGNGTISIGADAAALDADNQNRLTVLPPPLSVTVTAPAPGAAANPQKTPPKKDRPAAAAAPAAATTTPSPLLTVNSKLAWKYTQLAFLSAIALVLEHKIALYAVIAVAGALILSLAVRLFRRR